MKEARGDLLPIDEIGMDRLEAFLWSRVGEKRLLTPDAVRGEATTLEEVILEKGWPSLDEVRGKLVFVLNFRGPLYDYYTDVSPTLAGRAMFTKANPGEPEASIVVAKDLQSTQISDWVRKGYIVRARADTGVKEAVRNDLSNRDAALSKGAHILTTDFPILTPHPETGYKIGLPEDAAWRANPLRPSTSR